MLALSCLDKLIVLDPHTSWVSFLSSRGYLKHLIDGLLDSDEKLLSVLETVPTTLRPVYLYESKVVSLFLKLLKILK
jgi:nuclear pore complex protein Nup205